MTGLVALLRAVNVGGANKVPMKDLVTLCTSLGLDRVETYVQSGNVVFEASGPNPIELEKLLEGALAKRYKSKVEVFVRSAYELATVLEKNPYPSFAAEDPSHLLVVFLRRAPTAEAVEGLQKAVRGPERVSAFGAHLYAIYPKGIGRSKLTLPLIEKRLGVSGTARNWNTVSTLLELAKA